MEVAVAGASTVGAFSLDAVGGSPLHATDAIKAKSAKLRKNGLRRRGSKGSETMLFYRNGVLFKELYEHGNGEADDGRHDGEADSLVI